MGKPERRRLPPEEARKEILAAADEVLREGGASALSLSEVARRIGVSHQAVSYHFQSRENLLEATMARALDSFYKEVLNSVGPEVPDPPALISSLVKLLRDDDHARVLASLIFDAENFPPRKWRGAFAGLKEAFASVANDEDPDHQDASRVVELILSYALGQAIFGAHVRETLEVARNRPQRAARDEEMATWLADLLF